MFIELIKVAGLPAGIALSMVAYFMRVMAQRDRRDTERETKRDDERAKLGQRIDELEDFIKGKLAEMQQESVKALTAAAEAQRQSAESNRQLAVALAHVPCLVERQAPAAMAGATPSTIPLFMQGGK